MKQLNLTKPHLFILAGIPGSGKTFFAEHFADSFSLPVISQSLTANILFEDPDHSDDEQAIVLRINLSELDQTLKTKCHIVYDGYSATRVSRYELQKKAVNSGYTPVIIWVQTDIASAKRRAVNILQMSEQIFEKSTRKFTPPNANENHLVISGKHLPASQTRNVLNKLKRS